jgi:hypothetical protein
VQNGQVTKDLIYLGLGYPRALSEPKATDLLFQACLFLCACDSRAVPCALWCLSCASATHCILIQPLLLSFCG